MLRLDREPSGLAVLTIDAPPLNLYTRQLQEKLLAAVAELEATPARALLMRAEGKLVSGGVDVRLFDEQADSAAAKQLFDEMLDLPDRLAALPFPTVFAAHGLCLTWAFERAGVARAKEFVYTGDRYPAAVLHTWGVVNQVLPAEGFAEAAHTFATRLAAGPTKAHAATKQVLAHYERGGVAEANAHVTTIAAGLFDTEDLRGAVRSFLTEGPGKATFSGK
ncbi:enoyl-CoA hydratase/isomerase family protein [Crossiella equi]|uniref:enoyl-CoA hydratase/isomerase family protein n=1 Tax=Crossiella equi TaxID=130796 RepID=UPI000A39CA43